MDITDDFLGINLSEEDILFQENLKRASPTVKGEAECRAGFEALDVQELAKKSQKKRDFVAVNSRPL